MEINKQMNIHITLGKQDGLQFLTDVNVTMTSNPNKVEAILQQSQTNQPTSQDIILVFHFYIENGKQKQAKIYFQEALKEDRDQTKMSPVQKPFKTPTHQGAVQLIQAPGCIIIKYKFYPSQAIGQEEVVSIDTEFAKFQKATFNGSVSLKGQIRHNNKNRTNVKVDYADIKLESDQMSPSDFSKFLDLIQDDQEQLNFMHQIPALKMIGNLKRADFQLKLASFRQLRSYYNKAAEDKIKKNDKPFPYINQGLFRQRVSCFGIYKNKVAFKADAKYNGQDVFMRLVKVYTIFLFQGLNI